ncbi:methyl-accepting chemotaxis protein [Sporomusa termitida]|uniref:Methyl-accepting chemotaxis protein (MCP) signaling domain protein n=1 Tax=Sporomusa termitida TaxID=2377 RepID=A0A517DYD0_9FIRM|nr:methyl-accepting chemotaxis protein [Sporomusa termitida]QDR82360.1 Methyl-accepting chemotaxis protein (MCP) signaling domain protein [Sporomusa termitida]
MQINNSIRKKLLMMLLPFFILSFGILSTVSYYLSKQSLAISTEATAVAVGNDYANRLQANVMKLMTHLEDLASVPVMQNANDRAQMIAMMAETKQRVGVFDNVAFIYLDGLAVRLDGSTAKLGDREYFRKVVDTQKAYASEPLIARATGKAAVNLAVPVFNGGKLTGVLVGNYSLEGLSKLMQGVKFADSGYGFVCDDSGLLIAHPTMPEIVNKLDLSKKQVDPELKLKETELDDKLLHLFQASLDQPAVGEYRFGNIKQTGVFTPVNLPGGQRWITVVAAPAAELTKAASGLARTVLLVSLVFTIVAVIFVVVLSKRFAGPIQLIRDECLLLAGGDFRELQASVQSADEIGQLAQGFRTMRNNLRNLVTKVQLQAEQVAASSEELTASAQQSAEAANQMAVSITEMAQGAEQQAGLSSQISVVSSQISVRAEEISATMQEAAEIAGNTAQEAEQGRQAVEQAVGQMNKIGQGSEAVQAAITELAQGSQAIREIVSLISNIAGQTNLLALNAAIEAARAGEYGRGFAVVAEEVRKLAEESNQAAHQIGELIQKNQVNMDQAVAATQAGASGIKEGIAVVDTAGETFQKIVGAIMQLSAQIKEISEAINQMAEGSRTLVTSIQEIDQVNKKNNGEVQTVSAATEEQSASMEEIASSSNNLAKLAADLQEAVEKFKL